MENKSDASCSGSCSSCASHCSEVKEKHSVADRMAKIKHKIVVLSGKGGVGKSTVAVNLAMSLVLVGKKVGLLDVDVHGPSVPTMLGLVDGKVAYDGESVTPVEMGALKVISVGFLMKSPDDAIIWRGPMKMSVIEQFLKDVEWGELDYLIIDCPPGTGDEPLSVCQLVKDLDGAIVVTTPQEVASADVRKSINFCNQIGLKVLGVVENMSGFVCPHCNEITHIFKSGGGKEIAPTYDVPFLGSVPIDPAIGIACDEGKPFVHTYGKTETAKKFAKIVEPILNL